MSECLLAGPEYLRMAQSILYGSSVVSISVVRVCAVQKLFLDNIKQNSLAQRGKIQGVLTRQSTTSKLASRVASSGVCPI